MSSAPPRRTSSFLRRVAGAVPAAELELREGQTTRVEPANPARFFFFKEVLPGDLDQWSAGRDDAPLSPSSAHIVQRYGLSDLDDDRAIGSSVNRMEMLAST